jgi:hypothetical protein
MLLPPVIESWAPITAVVFLLTALACELIILITHPERQWYDARAIAESVKMLTWKYQVGGDPFGVDLPAGEVDENFLRRLNEIIAEFHDLDLQPAKRSQISEAMRHIRQMPLEERRELYRVARIEDQQAWYATKSDWNRVWAFRLQIGLVSLEVIAIAAAVFRALDLLAIDAYSFIAAAAAAGVGWLQIKQHQGLARAYSVASHELASIKSRLDSVQDEDGWKRFVDQAEEAISREHTLWRASRSA